MDRLPKPAPFPIGARVRYKGERRSWTEEKGQKIPIVEPGLVVTIAEVSPGYRGTLRQLRDESGPMTWEDTGEPILDTTSDGGSVYLTGGTRPMRCRIDHESAHDWERVK